MPGTPSAARTRPRVALSLADDADDIADGHERLRALERAARRDRGRPPPARARHPRHPPRPASLDAPEPGEPHGARARRARAPRRRAHQRRDRTAPVRLAANRRPPRLGDPAQARRADARPRDRRGRLGGLRAARVRDGRPRSLTSTRGRPSKKACHDAARAHTSVGRAPSAYPHPLRRQPAPGAAPYCRRSHDRSQTALSHRPRRRWRSRPFAPAASAAPQQAAGGRRPRARGHDRPVRLDEPVRRLQRAARTSSFTNIYPTLVEYNTKFKIEGDWAKSWTTSKDGLTWTFKLKPGKWSDGKPLTADDGAWTGNLILKYAEDDDVDARAVPLARDQADGAEPDDARDPATTRPSRTCCRSCSSSSSCRATSGSRSSARTARASRTTTRRAHLPIVGGGSFFVTKYDKKGTTILAAQPRLLRAEAAPRRRRHHLVRERRRDARGAQERRPRLRRRGAVHRRRPARQVGRHPARHGPGHARSATSASTRIPRRRRTASCSTRSCATRSRTPSTASRSSTSCSAGTRRRARTLLTPISAPYMNTEAAAREVRPRARQHDARQARLQARLGRHPADARGQLARRWPTT